eukprot:TRINITY_DN28025_c0_g1_i1.p1 TRINITY_DN28025_c0_g1~~TRINITY_DN28025_c0_g1_i1.p1  ORF type:complete len:526 (+),score=182.25 TRINITY_DN28025_c0_g1_i1:103-1680(+)
MLGVRQCASAASALPRRLCLGTQRRSSTYIDRQPGGAQGNGALEAFRPASWDQFVGTDPDNARRKQKARRELAAAAPLLRKEMVQQPTKEVEPAEYDPDDHHLECEPHAWEKVIQTGEAVPSDEFSRKTFILNAVKPDPETNLWIQIIVDALEEAKAEDISVIDTTQKYMWAPDLAEFVFLDKKKQRKIDCVIFASGETTQHIETIVGSIVDKGKKGLIPYDYSKFLKLDEARDSIFWKVTVACGKIMVTVAHPHYRDYKMVERKVICQSTEHAGRFQEDLLHSGGWVRVWDYWTPHAPCLPRTDYESVYAAERSYGWERLDTLKPEYVITDQDLMRRRQTANEAHNPLRGDELTLADLETMNESTVKLLRARLLEDKQAKDSPWFEVVTGEGGQQPSDAVMANYTIENDVTHSVTDEELMEYVERLKKLMDHNHNIMMESPETKALKDKEWKEYEERRTARIKKFGYYDFVEISNDLARRMLVCPDGVYTWPDGTLPDVNVQPHPENYRGKPRDTHWGPGWYDV